MSDLKRRSVACAACVAAVSVIPAWGWEITRRATSYDRHEFMPMLAPTEADIVGRVKAKGLLAGYRAGERWNPVAGWAEYDFRVPRSAWYELVVPGELWFMEYFVDGELILGKTTGGRISNLWLDAGPHVLRLQRWNVGGFQPALETWTLREAGRGVGSTTRFSAVRWGIAGNIIMAWVLTFPICGVLGYVFSWLLHMVY